MNIVYLIQMIIFAFLTVIWSKTGWLNLWFKLMFFGMTLLNLYYLAGGK